MAKIPFALGNVGSANSLAGYVGSLDSAQQNIWQNSASSTVYRFSTENRLMQAVITCYGDFPAETKAGEFRFILDGNNTDPHTENGILNNDYKVTTVGEFEKLSKINGDKERKTYS